MQRKDINNIAKLYSESMQNSQEDTYYDLITDPEGDKVLFGFGGRYFVCVEQESGDLDIFHSDAQGTIGDFVDEGDLSDDEMNFIFDKTMELLGGGE
jgi:hypothetical protein